VDARGPASTSLTPNAPMTRDSVTRPGRRLPSFDSRQRAWCNIDPSRHFLKAQRPVEAQLAQADAKPMTADAWTVVTGRRELRGGVRSGGRRCHGRVVARSDRVMRLAAASGSLAAERRPVVNT
jgi:hypothetical protein